MLGGFEDEDPAFEVQVIESREEQPFWDLSGSLELTGSVNWIEHESDTGTDYTGLQRLRHRLNLQLDVDLAEHWQARVEGWAFVDPAYALNGAHRYTRQVRGEYIFDAEPGEVWLQGKLAPWLDLKAGRQVVIWGRSETLRVLDVLNPLDNREPGRTDIEDLRLPVSMLRLDAYHGDWQLTAIGIPEIRFDENPVVGSDFFPGTSEPGEREPRHFEDAEAALRLGTIRSGWDLSFHGAWFWNDRPRFDFPSGRLEHDRVWLAGAAGNVTVGGWLFKAEAAWLEGVGYAASDDKQRVDALAGVEYYGLRDTTIVLEVAVRRILSYEPALRSAPDSVRETSEEIALRITRTFLREKLTFTAVGVVFEPDARDGAILRADLDYALRDGLTVGIGALVYWHGDLPPLDAWNDNDRLLFKIKWSF